MSSRNLLQGETCTCSSYDNGFKQHFLCFSARVYEEEDFQPILYNMNIRNELSDQKVIASLKDCENEMQKRIKDVDASSEVFQDLNAVYNRIKLERLLLQCLVLLYPSKSFSPSELEMSEISKVITNALELIPLIKKTIQRGTPVDTESKQLDHFFC